MKCKFCGKAFTSEKYTAPTHGSRSCGECTRYCMTKCKIASSTTTSWHREPCTLCEHNPYKRRYGREPVRDLHPADDYGRDLRKAKKKED